MTERDTYEGDPPAATLTRSTHTHSRPPKLKQEHHCESSSRQMLTDRPSPSTRPTPRTSTRRIILIAGQAGIGIPAAANLGWITCAVKRKLTMLQYSPEVLDGCLATTGLSMAPVP